MYAGQITILYILELIQCCMSIISIQLEVKKEERKRKIHYSRLDIHNLEGWNGVAGGREVQEEGDIHIYLWLIHVDVWQKPIQYCKAIILQLKINKFIRKEQ